MRRQLRRRNKARAHNRQRRAAFATYLAFWNRKTFIVVGDIAAHSGFVTEEFAEDIWSSDNPGGWTYQHVCGSHGTAIGEFTTRKEAEECLREFLKCDSVDNGTYCYSHNPGGR